MCGVCVTVDDAGFFGYLSLIGNSKGVQGLLYFSHFGKKGHLPL
jgi:hypothetical protein